MTAVKDRRELPRIDYMESIRGLAAVQVLLLHSFAAFLPGLVYAVPGSPAVLRQIHLSPLFFLYDGYSAVYVFFVLSGYVLTLSFARQLDHPLAIIAARIVRLGLPTLLATIVAALIYMIFERPHAEAGALVSSEWFSKQWTTP